MQVAHGMRPKLEIFGDDYDTPDGSPIRDYVHVMDLAEGHVAALDADLGHHRSRAFNLGTGVGTSVHEVVRTASEVTQRDIVGRLQSSRCRTQVASPTGPHPDAGGPLAIPLQPPERAALRGAGASCPRHFLGRQWVSGSLTIPRRRGHTRRESPRRGARSTNRRLPRCANRRA